MGELVRSGGTLASVRTLADARRAEQEALTDDSDPWAQADAVMHMWLRSPRFGNGTRQQYRAIYRSWCTWCREIDVPPFSTKRSDLEAYTRFLEKVGNPAVAPERRKPMGRASVARHMAAISSYYKRAISEEVTERNPVPPTDRPKVRRQSRQPHLSPDELRALIRTADEDGPRSGALVALLVLACLRVSEALSATVDDVSRQSGVYMLWTTRKGQKTEQVPLPPEVWQRVSAAINGRREGPILVTSGGKPLDRAAAWKLIKRLGRKAGLSVEIGPHTLRHAYITRGHELSLPVADLQVAAGHESVDTTRGYDRSHLDPSRHPSFVIAKDLAGS